MGAGAVALGDELVGAGWLGLWRGGGGEGELGVVGVWVPDVDGALVDAWEPGGEARGCGRVGEGVGADLEGGFVVVGKDGGCDAPFGFSGLRVGLEVSVADVAAAGAAEESLAGRLGVDVPGERGGYGGWRDELRFNAFW